MNEMKKPGNRLATQKSPYLLQHKDNPVWWQPWDEEAFAMAHAQDKPVFLSIGYSTCYWCHMMEKDSFESREVADLLNKHFISIKVDREERPDVDQIYMDAIVGLTGHGGWPMSVMLTPGREPFWGGTFFPRAQFVEILERIHELWTTERAKVGEAAARITGFLRSESRLSGTGLSAEQVLGNAVAGFSRTFDERFGGFGAAPKFPPSAAITFLLHQHFLTGDENARRMASQTLEGMARGGIFDHLGGGFARYSTDERWLVPHFEKMLYDNALLAAAYLDAYQATGNEMFASVARATLSFLTRELGDTGGAFYSALDAGEAGREGEYYVWTMRELESLLDQKEFEFMQRAYGITARGNFEHGTNVLHFDRPHDWRLKSDGHHVRATEKLLAARSARTRPHLDDKILTAWNGLALTAFARGFRVLGDEGYLRAAASCASFLRKNLYVDGELRRRYREGEARFSACLDDYAYLIEGLLELYQADFDPAWLAFARELQALQDRQLWDDGDAAYHYSSATDILLHRKDLIDGATPSPNSVTIHNLLKLCHLDYDEQLRSKVERMFGRLAGLMEKHPAACSRALTALAFESSGPREIAVLAGSSGDFADQLLAALRKSFRPDCMVALGRGRSGEPGLLAGKENSDPRGTVYVCRDRTCQAPVHELSAALRLLERT